MLQIAVCDDMSAELSHIAALTKEYLAAHGIEARMQTFSHPDALLAACEAGRFDLYLLDVVMPMVSGIDIGRELRARNDGAQIIFITSSEEFAVDAFALKAAHYVLKPFTAAQLGEALERALSGLAAAERTLPFRGASGGIQKVRLDDILYIQDAAQTLTAYLCSGVCTEARRSLARMAEELNGLAPGQFFSLNKGCLVNLRAVRTVGAGEMVLKNGTVLPVARRSARPLRDAYFDFIFQGGGAR